MEQLIILFTPILLQESDIINIRRIYIYLILDF